MSQLLHLDQPMPPIKQGDTVQLTPALARVSRTPKRPAFNLCTLASLGVIVWSAGLVVEWVQALAISGAVVIDWLERMLNIGGLMPELCKCSISQGSYGPAAAPWPAKTTTEARRYHAVTACLGAVSGTPKRLALSLGSISCRGGVIAWHRISQGIHRPTATPW